VQAATAIEQGEDLELVPNALGPATADPVDKVGDAAHEVEDSLIGGHKTQDLAATSAAPAFVSSVESLSVGELGAARYLSATAAEFSGTREWPTPKRQRTSRTSEPSRPPNASRGCDSYQAA
jgi:hypothetical protein